MLIHSAVITGSVQLNNTDVSSITNVAGFATTSSVDSLVVKTGSYASTSSLNELQSKTGSYATTSSVNNLQSVTGSYATTSSFGAYTSSNDTTNTTQNTRLSTIESVTGSYATTSSFGAYSSSINTFTSSATTRLNTIESVTGSYATTSSVNNLQSVTGSYATTGSNQFNGNQSISGSITSNGTITAQTLVVQTVTSSIEFVTGSTRNGSLSSNTHEFTGSMLMSGSLTVVTTGTEFQVNAGGVNIGNALTDNHIISGSVIINTNALFVSSSGNVGIGTSSPSERLEVNGGALKIILSSPDPFNSVQNTLILANGAGNGGAGNRISFNVGSATPFIQSLVDGANSNSGAALVFATPSSGTTGTERMRITSAGNVGIGTTSPSTLLHVNGTGRISSTLRLEGNMIVGSDTTQWALTGAANGGAIWQKSNSAAGGSDDRYLRLGNIDNNGTPTYVMTIFGNNVGIGNTNPLTKLHVTAGDASSSGRIRLTHGTSTSQIELYTEPSGLASIISTNSLSFETSGSERMRINVNGQVTLPYQPAFYAYYTAGASTTTTGAFTGFNSTRVNRGSHYNTSNGRFTAPIAGVYEFTFSALWRQSTATGAGEISLGLNGSNLNARGMGYFNFNVGSNGHAQTSVKAILSLSANDYVTAWIHTAGTSPSDWYYGENLGYFCGTLIG